MKKALLVIITLFYCTAFGQSIVPKATFNVELGLPVPVSNVPFRSIMQGLLNVSPSYQYCLENHLAFGGGVRYTYFSVNEFRLPEKIIGGMHSVGIFTKVGHEKFHTERFGTDFGIKYGFALNRFTTDALKSLNLNPEKANSAFAEATAGFILTADERNSYRWIVSYAIYGFGFKPWQIGYMKDAGYDPTEAKRATHFLTFGFGYTFYFGIKAIE